MTPLNYVNGMTVASYKKVTKWIFGESNILRIVKDLENRTFVIYLNELVYNEKIDLVDSFEKEFGVKIRSVGM